ncbi:MAG TPA: metalloregulator ArsR/SmtB family transcription factor [Patescibacteria group bacterium]|nr:metalloregulator ArsR/SmtB family transcription factor [Patescibacteria group bacterium]
MSSLLAPKKLPDDALRLIAARFKALSQHNRLKLIIALQDGEKNVSQLIELTGLKQANVSRHLQTLTDSGLLARRRSGLEVIYSIADPGIFDMCHQVCGGIQKRLKNQAKAFMG